MRFERDLCGRIVREETLTHDDAAPLAVRSTYDLAGDRQRVETSLGLDMLVRRDMMGDVTGVEVARALGPDLALTPALSRVEGPVASRPGTGPGPLGVAAPGARSAEVLWWAGFERDLDGLEVTRHLPGGITTRWQRHALLGLPEHRQIHSPTAVLQETAFHWDGERGVLLGTTDTALGARRYGYDSRLRLTDSRDPNVPGLLHLRRPDAAGNLYKTRERTDRLYGPGGVLREAEPLGPTKAEAHTPGPRVQYVHDPDGNLVEKTERDGGTWRYAWNGHGLLTQVERPDGTTVAFAYDGLARRLRKTVTPRDGDERTTRWLWDGDVPIREWTTARHTSSGSDVAASAPLLAAPLTTWIFEPESFTPLAKLEGDRRYAIVPDQVGAPNVLLDEAGQIAWRAQLDLYGVPQADVAETRCPWRWPGQYEDEETGLYYNGFRYYDRETGRYVSKDPVGLLGDLSIHGHLDDPLTWIDPFGLMRVTGTTRGGMPRASPTWRARYGPGVMRDHHVVPREHVSRVAAGLGASPNAAQDIVDRTIARIPNATHIDIHAARYNDEWLAWFVSHPTFTRAELRQQMESMMQRYNIPRSAMNHPRYCR